MVGRSTGSEKSQRVYCAINEPTSQVEQSMSGSGDQDIRTRYEDVCAELNMDEQTAGKAWTSYEEINNDYVLEVS